MTSGKRASESRLLADNRCCSCFSTNATLLLGVLIMQVIIALVTVIGSNISNSVSMAMDANHMVLDCLSYLVNFLAQLHRDTIILKRLHAPLSKKRTAMEEDHPDDENDEPHVPRHGHGHGHGHRHDPAAAATASVHEATWAELGSAFLTTASLLGGTIFLVAESMDRLTRKSSAVIDSVQGGVMIVCTGISLILSFISFSCFFCMLAVDGTDLLHAHSHGLGTSQCAQNHGSGDRQDANVNLYSAALHVASDCLRSLFVLLTGLVIYLDSSRGIEIDSYSSFLVSIVISGGCVYILVQVYNGIAKKLGTEHLDDTDTAQSSLLYQHLHNATYRRRSSDKKLGIVESGGNNGTKEFHSKVNINRTASLLAPNRQTSSGLPSAMDDDFAEYNPTASADAVSLELLKQALNASVDEDSSRSLTSVL